jgi:hypothetical protein
MGIGSGLIKKAQKLANKSNDNMQPIKEKASEIASNISDSSMNSLDSLNLQEKIESVSDAASSLKDLVEKKYTDSGAGSAASNIASKVTDQFDVISGQAMYDAVIDRLAIQDKYNDVLANKLLEALDRIEVLEKKIGITK